MEQLIDNEKAKAVVTALADALIKAAQDGRDNLPEIANAVYPYLFQVSLPRFDINA